MTHHFTSLACRKLGAWTINISYGMPQSTSFWRNGIGVAMSAPSLSAAILPRTTYRIPSQFPRSNLPCPALSFIAVVSLQFAFRSAARWIRTKNPLRVADSIIRFHSHVSILLRLATFLANVFPNLDYTIIISLERLRVARTMSSNSEDPLREYEQGPEFVEMVKRWKDVDQMLTARRLEFPISDEHWCAMQSSTIESPLKNFQYNQ